MTFIDSPRRAGLESNSPRCAAGLEAVAHARNVALIIDVDRIDRISPDGLVSSHASEHALIRALDALAHSDVLVLLVSRGDSERAERVHREVPRSWNLGRPGHEMLDELRALVPDVRVLAVCDAPAVLGALGPRDRAITVDAGGAIRSALWWLVGQRTAGSRTVM